MPTFSTIVNIAEQSCQEQITLYVGEVPVYISDFDSVKAPMPYIVIHGDSYEELIGPGVGIFKVSMSVLLRSHVKVETPQERDGIVDGINSFLYNTPADRLSLTDGFHCYGFVPVSGDMGVNTEMKAFEYHTRFDLYCMPRNNST
jgi:hypothetical protein